MCNSCIYIFTLSSHYEKITSQKTSPTGQFSPTSCHSPAKLSLRRLPTSFSPPTTTAASSPPGPPTFCRFVQICPKTFCRFVQIRLKHFAVSYTSTKNKRPSQGARHHLPARIYDRPAVTPKSDIAATLREYFTYFFYDIKAAGKAEDFVILRPEKSDRYHHSAIPLEITHRS